MASRYIDDDPELAHQHALTAARRAGRIGVVRETLAITAYQLGDFALALRELRTYRRITGRDDQLPLMADCERGLGRPEKALELARSVESSTLDTPVRVELAIVKSGARLDLGQTEAALEELRIPELRKDKAFEYSPALFASYAGVLEELGRTDEAAEWSELAERAIDALEAALAPGELEAVSIITERIETEDVPEAVESVDAAEVESVDAAEVESVDAAEVESVDAGEVESVDAAEVESADAGEVESADAGEVESVDAGEVESADAGEVESVDADGVESSDADGVESSDVGEVESSDVGEVESADAGEVESADAGEVESADAGEVESADAGEVESAGDDEQEVAAAPSAAPAPHGDALFGDALFGDELIERRDDER
ncbi:hypothetical protein [Agrococcus sp. DT81.2]|uniref:hypothetical protein n=1 Tax=Agrococcus sp. DT81.2 TaxID=3393414 RepID=UPI003CE54C36